MLTPLASVFLGGLRSSWWWCQEHGKGMSVSDHCHPMGVVRLRLAFLQGFAVKGVTGVGQYRENHREEGQHDDAGNAAPGQ